MTQAQRNDLECVKWFIPRCYSHIAITEEDELNFLKNSERGWKRGDESDPYHKNPDGYIAMLAGKMWRGRMMEIYEEGLVVKPFKLIDVKTEEDQIEQELRRRRYEDSSAPEVPYYVLLGGVDEEIMPRVVVNFLKKELFKGIDAERIENVYQGILEQKSLERGNIVS